MGGFALDFDQQVARALAPHHHAVGGAARFQAEGDIMLPGEGFDQAARAFRKRFLIRVHHERDLGEIVVLALLQQLDGLDRGRDAALVVHHPGSIGALALDAEGTRSGCAVDEHRVHVCHEQNLALAAAFQGRHQVLAYRRGHRRGVAHFHADFAELARDHRAYLVQPFLAAGARIDVDQPLEQGQQFRPGCHGAVVQGRVFWRGGSAAAAQ